MVPFSGLVLGSCDRFSSCSSLFPYSAQCLVASLWARIALSLSVAGIFVFIAVCDPSWCADTSIWARIALSLSVAGTLVFIAVVSYVIYGGMCVSTAPVAEPTVMSFTVPLNGWTIVATTTVVTLCSSSADCLATGEFASRCRLVVVFLSWWCLRFCLGQCEADCWKILLISSSKGC